MARLAFDGRGPEGISFPRATRPYRRSSARSIYAATSMRNGVRLSPASGQGALLVHSASGRQAAPSSHQLWVFSSATIVACRFVRHGFAGVSGRGRRLAPSLREGPSVLLGLGASDFVKGVVGPASTDASLTGSRAPARHNGRVWRTRAGSDETSDGDHAATSSARHQFCKQASEIPKSLAICLIVTPCSRRRATAIPSSRNSWEEGLGTATTFQAAPKSKPDQMSPAAAADPDVSYGGANVATCPSAYRH